MKRLFVVLIAVLFVAGSFGIAGAANIAGSKHDFSDTGTGQGANENTSGEICNTCHAPHSPSNASDGPLWDHAVTAVTNFTAYSDVNGSMDASLGQPGTVSKLCLSCHDGTVAIDSFGGATGNKSITGGALVDTDLSNDHPVGFTYDSSLATDDGELETPSGGSVGTNSFPLFGSANDKMECATCHNAHDGAATYFLRLDNDASALCKNCHQK
jgi:predicted CXXCH cytochrome family protein